MRHQDDRRDSKTSAVIDEECSIPASLVESHRTHHDHGPLAQADPPSYVLSMSEYDGKAHAYDLYDYQAATRPEQGQHIYAGFSAHPNYSGDYVAPQAQVPSGLPQSSSTLGLVPSAQQYSTHDPTYYGQQVPQYPAYLEAAPRPSPEITSYTPQQGQQGTKVTVYFQSVYDFDAPQVTPVIMFGQKRCESILSRAPSQGHVFQYSLCAEAPPLALTDSHSAQMPLTLVLDETSVAWESPSLEFGSFTYVDPPTYYQLDSPQMQPHLQVAPARKRKLSPEASPRRSPVKKPSMPHFGTYAAANSISPFRRPSMPELYHTNHARSFSGPPELPQGYGAPVSRIPSAQYYTQQAPQPSQSPSWNYQQTMPNPTRSPSAATVSTASKSSQLLPSPAGPNPPLIRTSTLQQSPTTPGAAVVAAVQTGFNPYAIYPTNSKAMLKLDKDLNTMSDKWTPSEWETRRRLVQFRRSQSGSTISATFEPVTLEDRIPNSICVSCIWWEEKQECYVTSVDTISLLESLVAVRFTVEEKNRIRRNLEGFRPATVSKTKPDSEEFFKLIMGFPNPKPRNIEKDVKVFPWRILATALKKIIGKYSASYSSTAGALHTPGASSYSVSRPSDVILEQRTAVSPRSTSSSTASHGHAYAPPHMQHSAYPPHSAGAAGLGAGPSADLRIAVPTSAGAQTTSWHQPTAHYASDPATGGTWDFRTYIGAAPATGLPGSAQSYPYQQRISSLTGPGAMPEHTRYSSYDGHGHPTTNA